MQIIDVRRREIINGILVADVTNDHAIIDARMSQRSNIGDAERTFADSIRILPAKALGTIRAKADDLGWKVFSLGAISLTLSALIVPGHYRILGIGRSHEHLAQISSVAFCLSLILYLGAILRLPPPHFSLRAATGFVVILPVTALIVSRLSLFLAYEFSSSVIYRAVKVSLWSSLALWEWIGAFCIYLFLCLMTLEVPTTGARADEYL